MAPIMLTPELIQRIIYFLIHDWTRYGHPLCQDAGEYAAVSPLWQDTIERSTFATLYLDLERLSEVNSVVTSRRRRYVREILLEVVLPWPGPRQNPEKDKEKLRNNRALQATFEAFLQSLSQWTVDELHPGRIGLRIFAPLPVEKRLDSPSWEGERGPMWNRRYAGSVLELTDPARIAEHSPVVAISEINMDRPRFGDRHISIVAICALVAKLPAAKRVSVDWWKWRRFSGMRNGNVVKLLYLDLADALSQINHPIDNFHICDDTYDAMSRSQLPPDTTLSSEGEDGLSKAFHTLSQRSQTLHIDGIIVSDELFFPRTLSAHMAEPRWERLVTFHLCYPPVTPSGEWLFIPDPNASDDSEDETPMFNDWISITASQEPTSRRCIATPAMQQFYMAAGRAALQMPALEWMTLDAGLGGYDEYWHKFWYHAKKSTAKALWTSSSGFIPDDDVLECWRKVPRKYLKGELEVEISSDPRVA
ncbi:uncharacterized protein Triagg1_6974 [Trichoderma aggressivum f. europaeum]|uniref:DUF6546 domain-containing protein n=1 Tax=Trichoderma aggressivum f. europaeum TaxID=173218 RepID=A0AAE1IC96_9HYPO|nr:hypothetical protein Triagg1_6974 [Trichoderma aggressivum f. europaeum]